MFQKKLAVVLGASSGQSASVANRLLDTGLYRVRGVARSITSKETQCLVQKGMELCQANFDDPPSLANAFAGANVLFAVTKMYDGDVNREISQGKHIANAAASVDAIEHFIWSTLPSAWVVTSRRISVPYMDGKAEVDEHIITMLPALAQKTTFVWGGFYAENVLYPNYAPNLLATAARHVWIQPVDPNTLIPMVGDHIANIGIIVERVIQQPKACLPMKYVMAVTEWMANGAILEMWAHIAGEAKGEQIDAVYVKSDLETVAALWPQNGREMGELLQVLETMGQMAWTKKGISPVTLNDLGLKVGKGAGDLTSVEAAFKKFSSSLR